MSQPIDIPSESNHRRKRLRQDPRTTFPAEDGPYFGLIEVFEDGDASWTISSGRTKYVRVSPQRSLPPMAFIVEKNRILKTITIDFTSLVLRQSIHRAILNHSPSLESVQLDFNTIMRHYNALKFHLERLRSRSPDEDATSELSLLASDFLLERFLFEGLGLEVFQRQHNLQAVHIQDIHKRSVVTGLEELETLFSLGVVPDEIHFDYLTELSGRYTELALSGDEIALRELCEPLVRSGEVEIAYDDDLLLELLQNGQLDTYMYIVDLLERLRGNCASPDYGELMDISFDPFHIAIRLGHVPTVRIFTAELYSFEGCVKSQEDRAARSLGLVPLTAAVFWSQPQIVAVLLDAGPVYVESLEQAMAMAAAANDEFLLSCLSNYSRVATEKPSIHAPFSSPPIPLQPPVPTFPISEYPDQEISRSLSQITDYLFGQDQLRQPMEVSSLSEETMADSSMTSVSSYFDIDSDIPPPAYPPLTEGNHRDPRNEQILEYLESDSQPHNGGHMTTTSHILEKSSHRLKRRLGKELVMKLGNNCTHLREFLAESKDVNSRVVDSLTEHMATCEVVWELGIEAFHALTRNQPPSNLAQVLSCLFVADAVSMILSRADPRAHSHFLSDLSRWRAAVSDSEQIMFDDIITELWPLQSLTFQTVDIEDTHYFEQLAQNILSADSERSWKSSSRVKSGTQLYEVQNEIGQERRARERMAAQARVESNEDTEMQNIGSILSKLTKDTDSAEEDEIEWADYIHLSVLEEEASSGEERGAQLSEPHSLPPWKETNSLIFTLLSSPTFSMILGLLTAIRSGQDNDADGSLRLGSLDTGRPTLVLEKFLSLKSTSNRGITRKAKPSEGQGGRGRMAKMKANSRKQPQPRSLSHSLATSFGSPKSYIRASMSSPGASSFFSATDLSSTDTARSTKSTSERLRCLSSKCPKTFSSVSNRNKHMREGCTFREKKGYRCRNGDCTKVLTTKWYRNTHEQTRCRFR